MRIIAGNDAAAHDVSIRAFDLRGRVNIVSVFYRPDRFPSAGIRHFDDFITISDSLNGYMSLL